MIRHIVCNQCVTRFLKLFQMIWSPLGITANAISDLLEIYVFLWMVQEQKHLTHHGITLPIGWLQGLQLVPSSHQSKARLLTKDRVPISVIPRDVVPFSHLYMDVIGPLFDKAEYNYCLRITDSCTRFPFAFPLRAVTACN